MIRLIFAVIGFLIFYIGFLPVYALMFIVRHFDEKKSLELSSAVVRGFLRAELFICGTKLVKEGLENIPADVPVLFVGNHRSDFDILVTASCMKRPAGYVAKSTMAGIPIMAGWMKLIGCIFIDRNNTREGLKAIIAAIDQIKGGTSVFIFPEGTRNRNEDKDIPMEFKEGSLKIAQKAKCLIVPVVLKDTERIFEAQKPLISAETVRVRFLKPIYTEDIPAEHRKTAAAYVRGLIEEELAAMNSEEHESETVRKS